MGRSIKVTPKNCLGTYMFIINGWGSRSVRNCCLDLQYEFARLEELEKTEAGNQFSGSSHFDAQDSVPVTSEKIRQKIHGAVNDPEAGELLYTVLSELHRSGYQARIAIVCDSDGKTVHLRYDHFNDKTIAQGNEDKWAIVVCNAIGQYFYGTGDTLDVSGTQAMISAANAIDSAYFVTGC